jgi:hypothetical protein
MESHCLVLSYRVRIGSGDWLDIREAVPIVYMPCRFGGTRSYFLCPNAVSNVYCGRRVVKLYGVDRYFLCRHCYRLAYASQSEDALNRTLRRASKIRLRLAGKPGMAAGFPSQPKGMWRRTYERLRDRAIDAEIQADEVIAIYTRRLRPEVDELERGGS